MLVVEIGIVIGAMACGLIWGYFVYREFARIRELRKVQLTEIDQMDGSEFEAYLRELLVALGWRDMVDLPNSGDFGADLMGRFPVDDELWVFQAKDYSHPVGNGAVQELFAGMAYHEAYRGAVITNSTFTKAARQTAKSLVDFVPGVEIQLWDRSWLEGALKSTRERKNEAESTHFRPASDGGFEQGTK